jgi:hypothetical protein
MHHAILWLTVLGGAAALAFGPFRLRVQAWLDRVRKALGWRKTLLLVFMALLLVGVGLTIGPEVAIAFSGDLFVYFDVVTAIALGLAARQLSYVIPLVLARARSWAEVLARTCRAVIGARARRRRLARRGGVRGGTTEDPEPGLPWAVC